jgi:hypothetical protein
MSLARIVSLYDDASVTPTIISAMIAKMIEEADQQIKDLLCIPITIHEEIHVIDEDVSLTEVYLGSYDDTPAFLETWHGTELINVQGCVATILCVCINGVRVKTTDDDYPWSWTHSATPTEKDYITFTNDLSDGDIIKITYSYDPYAITVPFNVRKASKYLAASDLIEHLIGLRQSATAFEAQGDSAERIPDREALFSTYAYLKKIAEEAMASIGYGFTFTPIKG